MAKFKETPQNRKNVEPIIKSNKITYDNIEINGEILLLCDSNGMKVDENILAKDVNCQKIFVPKLDSINLLLGAATGGTNLKEIWVNVGTNDLDVHNGETQGIISAYEESIKLLQEKFPMVSFYISTIMPRKSGKFIKEIKEINNLFYYHLANNRLRLI